MESPVKEEHLTVAVRIRPFVQRELEARTKSAWEVPGPTSIKEAEGNRFFVFDRVFDSEASTSSIFEEVGEKVIWNSMEGFNGCIFCYGQTGSGKTFTMHGNRKTNPGIVPLTTNTIFGYIQEDTSKEFLLRCSYVELYNECVNDLLNPNNMNLSLQEDKKRGIKIVGVTEEVCTSVNQMQSILYMGETNKQIASTNFNQRSSRSHSIFRIIIESKEINNPAHLTTATLNLIDLAGSESAQAHGPASTAERSKEMRYINRSLLTLGTVIMRLSDKANGAPIPFRDSKLTRLLRPALEGNSKVIIVCNISPSSSSYEESLSTIKFAQRAKKIKQKITKNQVLDSSALITKYQREIENLRQKLSQNEQKLQTANPELKAKVENLAGEVQEIRHEKESLNATVESLVQEKFNMLSELEKLSSFILVSDNVKPKETLQTPEKTQTDLRARKRLFESEKKVPESINFNKKETFLVDIDKIQSEFRNRRPTFEANTKVPEAPQLDRKDTLLLDDLDHIEDLLPEPTEELSASELLQVIAQQDKMLDFYQSQLNAKEDQISVLKDELTVCRNNISNMQKQLKQIKKV